MKTKTFILVVLLALPMWTKADDMTIIHPADGSNTYEDKTLTGYTSDADGLFINRDKFTSAVPGNMIKIGGWNVTSGAKLYFGKFNPSQHIPGSDDRAVSDLPIYIHLTQGMIDTIKENDLRIYGEKMTINRVELSTGKAGSLKYGTTIWTGYFEIDSWNTLELFHEAFDGINLNNYVAIRIYHEAEGTNFVMKLFADNFSTNVGDSEEGSITITETYAELKLTDALRDTLSGLSNKLFIQGDKGSEKKFNLTDVVLLPTAIEGCDNCFYVTY